MIKNSKYSSPFITDHNVTFLWEGPHCPMLIGDFNLWDIQKAIPLESKNTTIWETTLAFPPDAYIEYCFIVDGCRTLDPKNPRKVRNGTGGVNNYFYMPQAAPSPYLKPRKLRGRVLHYSIRDELRLSNPSRKIILYQPDAPGPYPLLVVFDGKEYLERARIISIIENLLEDQKIRPVALALIPNAGTSRFVEYACNDSTVSFVVNRVLPLAQENLNLLDIRRNPGAYAIMGASMGGTMALYVALRHPEIFGKVISQGGAFRLFDEDFSIFEMVDRPFVPPIQIWMDVGRFDFVYEANQRIHHILVKKGYNVAYREVNGGHNYTTWRNDLPNGLMRLFSFE
ncbi:MAG: alpha/beta hydrolase-fold protein [Thermanaerothrix sp.]|uniref:alpha/beta hydrolase-fold protein n=1 Tax=Thermanaerothrix sp. TaxID=2972675 RepID=UPI003C7C5D8D